MLLADSTAPSRRVPSADRLRCWCVAIAIAAFAAGCAVKPRDRLTTYPRLDDQQAQSIAIHALSLVGTPYRYGGNTVEGGFDCSGLIGFVYRAHTGLAPPRTVAALADFGQSVARRELRSGDLVLFGGGRPTHAGIYIGNGRFVHAPSSGGEVRLDRLESAYWSRQTLAVRRP